MDLAYTISDKAVLITPARFLFNAGATPEDWNHKMINDNHLKIVYFENVSYNIFPNTNFGSIVVTYWDKNKNFEPIGIMTNFSELNLIIKKLKINGIDTLDNIISGRGVYKLTQTAHNEHPEIEDIQSRGHKNDVGTGVFGKLENIIFLKINLMMEENILKYWDYWIKNREYFWVDTRYITHTPDYTKFKVVLPKANGTGLLEDKPSMMIGAPLVLEPFVAFTETFISIGAFDNEEEAHNALKYIKSKFARALLGYLKLLKIIRRINGNLYHFKNLIVILTSTGQNKSQKLTNSSIQNINYLKMILILLRVKLDRWINIPNTFYFIDHYGKTIDNL